ncbi:MAG: hypothetical protein M3126_01985 [Candidatus Eremiobacteraeota bacterium]|nr:hypothetical protein [Candidatus Eremiobacteraeota bacterium]
MTKTLHIKAALCAAILLAAALPGTASMQAAKPGVHAKLLEKTSAKRFKRGVRRTARKIRHFIHRASGRH